MPYRIKYINALQNFQKFMQYQTSVFFSKKLKFTDM